MTKSSKAYRCNTICKGINFIAGKNNTNPILKKIPIILIYMNRPRRGLF